MFLPFKCPYHEVITKCQVLHHPYIQNEPMHHLAFSPIKHEYSLWFKAYVNRYTCYNKHTSMAYIHDINYQVTMHPFNKIQNCIISQFSHKPSCISSQSKLITNSVLLTANSQFHKASSVHFMHFSPIHAL